MCIPVLGKWSEIRLHVLGNLTLTAKPTATNMEVCNTAKLQ